MALDLVIAALAFAYGVYLILSGTFPYPWLIGSLFVGDFYLRLWRRPIRRARFFEDHFELSGLGVALTGGYESVMDV
jgi:hypothetical protein